MQFVRFSFFFFFNDTATTEIYTLSLHDALPILNWKPAILGGIVVALLGVGAGLLIDGGGGGETTTTIVQTDTPSEEAPPETTDRKSTRLNSSHANISYAVFCLKKKKNHTQLNSI